MKKLFILLFMVFLFSCEKEILKPCEINQTFTLFYNNQRWHLVTLVIGVDEYLVYPEELKEYTVPVSVLGNIYVKKDDVIISRMVGTPNACAKYNYFW